MSELIDQLAAIYGEIDKHKTNGWEYITHQINTAQYHIEKALSALMSVQQIIEDND